MPPDPPRRLRYIGIRARTTACGARRTNPPLLQSLDPPLKLLHCRMPAVWSSTVSPYTTTRGPTMPKHLCLPGISLPSVVLVQALYLRFLARVWPQDWLRFATSFPFPPVSVCSTGLPVVSMVLIDKHFITVSAFLSTGLAIIMRITY